MVLAAKTQRMMLYDKLGSLASYTKPEVLNLDDVVLHSELCFILHGNTVTKVVVFNLRNIAKVLPFLSQRNLLMHLLQGELITVMLFLLGFLRKQYILYNLYKMHQHPHKNKKERSYHSRFKRTALVTCIIQDILKFCY